MGLGIMIWWGLKEIFSDRRFLLSVIIGMLISLFTIPLLMDAVGRFKEGNLLSALPISEKMVKIAVVGEHPLIAELENNSMVEVVRTDEATALELLKEGKVHGVFIVNSTSGSFIGRGIPLSNLAESAVKDAVDKFFRKDSKPLFNLQSDLGLEELLRSLLAPFLMLTPLFIWSLPIIQSVAYERENKVVEVIFASPTRRAEVLASKVLSNLIFAMVLGAVWMLLVPFFGLHFSNSLGVYIILVSMALLVIVMNALVSSIASNANEATLASSISSTIIITLFFSIAILKVFPATEMAAKLSPATYIAEQVSGEATPFPFNLMLVMYIISATAFLLALSAFSTEAFAFSLKPGLNQLYEGMLEILHSKMKAAFAMGFVAFSITLPVELVAIGLTFFIIGPSAFLLLLSATAAEEGLKAVALNVLKPKKLNEGAALGALVGLAFGISESLLLAPVLELMILVRIVPILVHTVCSSIVGAGYAKKYFALSIILAILLHMSYNLYLIRQAMGMQ
ncbi:ABC transporter permease [Candidatus Micrarchaeota archaeon]|nr:ABC transporter permease [Candidatus Micrarchaeota archaeon]